MRWLSRIYKEVIEEYMITQENQEHAIDEIIGQLKDPSQDSKYLRDYARQLLDETDNWGKLELSDCLASFDDGYQAGNKSK